MSADGPGGLSESANGVRTTNPGSPILVFSLHLDLTLAWSALRGGARDSSTSDTTSANVPRPRGGGTGRNRRCQRAAGLPHNGGSSRSRGSLPRQREILGSVNEGLSNTQIAKWRLFLVESNVKQHLHAAYEVLGVETRIEAAKLVRNGSRSTRYPNLSRSCGVSTTWW